MRLILVVLCLFASTVCGRSPIWKVFCSGSPLYRGRIDPIVNPGAIAGHSHKVAGGNHFSAAQKDSTPLSVFQEMFTSTCTTCSIGQVDLSAYWHPDLYYKWANGTFSLVPNGGLTVYYLSRAGSGAQANPDWKPIPKGLRMLAGSPFRRNFTGSVADKAITYVCLTAAGVPGPSSEPNNFPTDQYFCANGMRAQVFFPMCWDGKNLDSPDHKSHMAYPSSYNGGNCPDTHPVRIPGVFFEAFYSVSDFPHGTGTNPFVWSCGDPTGYGFHGDFLSGWDTDVMAAALANTDCDNGNPAMAFGNNVKACPPLAPYVQNSPGPDVCSLESPIPLTEDLGISSPIAALPGCNPLTYGPADAVACSSPPSPTVGVSRRFLLRSVSSGKYLSASNNQSVPVSFSANSSFLTLNEIFNPISVGSLVAIVNENTLQYLSVNGPNSRVMANRGSPSNWEYFTLENHAPNVAIISNRNAQYLTLGTDGTFSASATSVAGDTELFVMEAPGGGSIGNAVFQTNAALTRYSGFSGDTAFTGTYTDAYGYGDSNTKPIANVEGPAATLAAFCFMTLSLLVALL